MAVESVVRRVVARGRSPDRVPEDPRGEWLSRLDKDSRPAAKSNFDRFMVWLRTRPGWEYVAARDILIRHIQAEDDYVILDRTNCFCLFAVQERHRLRTGRNRIARDPNS